MVDIVGDLRVEVPQRVVGERCEMNNSIIALQFVCSDVTDVFAHPRYVGQGPTGCIVAIPVEFAVESVNLMARLLQERNHD